MRKGRMTITQPRAQCRAPVRTMAVSVVAFITPFLFRCMQHSMLDRAGSQPYCKLHI